MLTNWLNAWTVILLYFCMSYGWCWQHSRGHWGSPGGKADVHTDVRRCVLRARYCLNILSTLMHLCLTAVPGGWHGFTVLLMRLGDVTGYSCFGGWAGIWTQVSAGYLVLFVIVLCRLSSSGACRKPLWSRPQKQWLGQIWAAAGCRKACLGNHLSDVDIPSEMPWEE